MPRNKELMRVFRDVEFVEALGSGMQSKGLIERVGSDKGGKWLILKK